MTKTAINLLALVSLLVLFTVARPETANAACAGPSGVAADILYNSTQKYFQYCDDTNWLRLNQRAGSGAGGCLTPTGAEGSLIYNYDARVLQGCAGNVWRGIGTPAKSVWKTVVSGNQFACGIKTDDTLWCWGINTYGAVGDNTTTYRPAPVQVSGGGTWKMVSANASHTCGIKSDDTLWCWGYNFYGRLGDNSTTNRSVPTQVNGGGTWKKVSAGGSHTCAIKSDDTLWCWGYNFNGVTGLNTGAGNTLVPTTVSGGGGWKQISAGGSHTCAIKSDDTLWCWGSNSNGRTALNTGTGSTLVPTTVTGGGSWKQVESGTSNGCAIKSDDSMWCWGGGNGVGDGTTSQRNVVTAVAGGGTWKSISYKGSHACGVKSDNTLWCWGFNFRAQLGDGTDVTKLSPTAVIGGGTWSVVATGYWYHTCAIKSDNALHCWGLNFSGDGNLTFTGDISVPAIISGGGDWKQVTAGTRHTCGIKFDDTGWCWGDGANGRLGNNGTTVALAPVTVSGGSSWKQLSAGSTFTCGIKTDNTLWCWGYNTNGELGNNTTSPSSVPVSIAGGGTWKQVSAGGAHGCAIKSDDTLSCWGFNGAGYVGDGTTTQRLVPTPVSGGGAWKYVSASWMHTCALKMDDTIWCWGRNSWGSLGDNTTTNRIVPTAIFGGGTWKAVTANLNGDQFDDYGSTCAIKSDDTLWCWGDNSRNQLGDGTGVQRNVPTAVSGGGTWKALAAGMGGAHFCAIKPDDTLWCWGANNYGQLGDATTTSRSVPTIVTGGYKWKQATTGGYSTSGSISDYGLWSCGISMSDEVLCWGTNYMGQLTSTQYSAPYGSSPLHPGCNSPSGKDGAMVFNSSLSVMQYCDGNAWVKLGK